MLFRYLLLLVCITAISAQKTNGRKASASESSPGRRAVALSGRKTAAASEPIQQAKVEPNDEELDEKEESRASSLQAPSAPTKGGQVASGSSPVKSLGKSNGKKFYQKLLPTPTTESTPPQESQDAQTFESPNEPEITQQRTLEEDDDSTSSETVKGSPPVPPPPSRPPQSFGPPPPSGPPPSFNSPPSFGPSPPRIPQSFQPISRPTPQRYEPIPRPTPQRYQPIPRPVGTFTAKRSQTYHDQAPVNFQIVRFQPQQAPVSPPVRFQSRVQYEDETPRNSIQDIQQNSGNRFPSVPAPQPFAPAPRPLGPAPRPISKTREDEVQQQLTSFSR